MTNLIEKYTEMVRSSYHTKTPAALENAIKVIQEGTTPEHFSKAMHEAAEKFGLTSDHRNIFVELYRDALKHAQAKFEVGAWVSYKAKNGRVIKAQITELDNDTKQYTVKPHDNVHKEEQIMSESLLAAWEQEEVITRTNDEKVEVGKQYLNIKVLKADNKIVTVELQQPDTVIKDGKEYKVASRYDIPRPVFEKPSFLYLSTHAYGAYESYNEEWELIGNVQEQAPKGIISGLFAQAKQDQEQPVAGFEQLPLFSTEYDELVLQTSIFDFLGEV